MAVPIDSIINLTIMAIKEVHKMREAIQDAPNAIDRAEEDLVSLEDQYNYLRDKLGDRNSVVARNSFM